MGNELPLLPVIITSWITSISRTAFEWPLAMWVHSIGGAKPTDWWTIDGPVVFTLAEIWQEVPLDACINWEVEHEVKNAAKGWFEEFPDELLIGTVKVVEQWLADKGANW